MCVCVCYGVLVCVCLHVLWCVFVCYGICHSPLQYRHLSIVGEEVRNVLVKAESWVATRDGPISELVKCTL